MSVSGTISTAPVTIIEGSIKHKETVDLRDTLDMTVRDDAGTAIYQVGQPVTLSDANGSVFTGFVHDAKASNITPNPNNFIVVQCTDNTMLATRRHALKDFESQYAGDIACDLVSNYLAQDGVTASYAIRRDTTAAQFGQGTRSGTVGATTIDDGDLELAPAGTAVSYTENTTARFSGGTLTGVTAANNSLAPTAFSILKMHAVMAVSGVSTAYTFVKIWSGSVAIVSGGSGFRFTYDLFIDPASPEAKIGLDIVFSDGSTLRDTSSSANNSQDAQFIAASPANDLTGLATVSWYTRSLALLNYVGKTISYVTICVLGVKPGTYTGYVKNATVTNGSGTVVANVFTGSLAVNPPQQLQSYGYSDTEVSVVNGYNLYTLAPFSSQSTAPFYGAVASKITTSISVDPVKLLQSSFISWQATVPDKTALVVQYSLDNGNSYTTCTNAAPLPNLPAGMSLAGKSLLLQYQFYALPGALPEVAPTLNSVSLSLQPSYIATKSDVLYNAVLQSDWSAGTPTNLVAASTNELTLNGIIRTWDDGSVPQSVFSSVLLLESVNNRSFTFWGVGDTTEGRSRLDFAGTWQNFTCEVDIKVDNANVQYGLVYRTTNWNNANNTFAYAVYISTTAVTLGRGSNSGSSGSFTQISTATLALSTGSWHRLKVVVNGSSHQISVDDLLMLNSTDATFSAAGNIGLRINNTNSGTGNALTMFFDNFGVVASLSGTWLSPSTSLTSAGTYGTSLIFWRDKSLSYYGLSNTSALVEASINGGSTWQTCTNGGPIPNFTAGQSLSSVNLLLRVTLASSTASSLAAIDDLHAYVLGSYSSSGSRISPALLLNTVGRAGSTLASWNGVQPTNTMITVATSLNNGGTWDMVGVGASGSGSVTGITVQPDPIDDTFTSNTSSLYIATSLNANATWTWDTANSRVTATGGNNALLEYIGLSAADVDVMADMDESDNGGIIARVSGNTMYALYLYDASATTFGIQNKYFIYAIVSGAFTQLATGSISFTRGTPHRFHLLCVGSTITATMDGTTLYSGTDTHISSPGTAGLLAGSLARFYQFRVQQYGEDVTTFSALTKVTMTSTDPTATPYLTDLTLSVRGPDIQSGVLIPKANYSLLAGNTTTLAAAFDDLAKQCGNIVWDIDKNRTFIFRKRSANPSPWIATGMDILLSRPPQAENSADLYRNDQFATNGTDIISFTKSFTGDGQTQTWTLDFPVDTLTSVTVNSVSTYTIGVRGVDTGKDFYYQQGSPVLSQDASESPLVNTQTVTFDYDAQIIIAVEMRDDAAIAARAALDSTPGIVQETVDGTGLSKQAMIQKCQGLLQQYAQTGRTFTFTTKRSGLASNQILTVFLPALGIVDGQFLITDITTTYRTTMANNIEVAQPFYAVTVTSGPVVGDYTRWLSNVAKGAAA